MIDIAKEELKEEFSDYDSGSVGLAQINAIAGDIEYNSKKVLKYIIHAQNIGLDLVISPELALTGYPVGDAILRYPLLADTNMKWLNEIAKLTTKTIALIGFLEPANDKNNKFYSSVAVLGDAKVLLIKTMNLMIVSILFHQIIPIFQR